MQKSKKTTETLLQGGGVLNGERIELLGLTLGNFFPFCSIGLLVRVKQKPRQGMQSSPCSYSGAVCPSLVMCGLRELMSHA